MVNKHQAVSPVVVVGLVVGFGLHGVVVGAESENSKYSTGAYFDGGGDPVSPSKLTKHRPTHSVYYMFQTSQRQEVLCIM